MLNLKVKGIDNAAAVLGGYDALVKAGLPTETGSQTTSAEVKKSQPVNVPATKKEETAPVVQKDQASPEVKSKQAAPSKSGRTKRHGRSVHRG